MGNGVSSRLDRATKTNYKKSLYMTAEEVREDEANEAAQRAAMKFCVETIYVGAAIRMEALATPGHHVKSALVVLDEDSRDYPVSCLVDPFGDITITTAKNKHRIRAQSLAQLKAAPSTPVLADAKVAVTETSIVVEWSPGDETVDKWEIALAAGAQWTTFGTIDVFTKGDALSATAEELEPDTVYTISARAHNERGWSKWSGDLERRTNPAPPDPPDPPFAGVVLTDAVALFWRPPPKRKKRRRRIRSYELWSRRGSDEDPQMEPWALLYAGRLQRYVACGLVAGATYSFAVAAINDIGRSNLSRPSSFRLPTTRHSGDGVSPPENAAMLRCRDLWLELWDPGSESIFYFHRATGLRRDEPPDVFSDEGTTNDDDECLLLANDDAAMNKKVPPATRFRLKRFRLLKQLKKKQLSRRGQVPTMQQRLPIMVRRSRLFRDSLVALKAASAGDLRTCKLKIEYEGEAGIDSGGLTKDWYLQFSEALKKEGFFDGDNYLELRPNSAASLDEFRVLGRFIGKTIVDQQAIDLPCGAVLLNSLRGVVGGDNPADDLESPHGEDDDDDDDDKEEEKKEEDELGDATVSASLLEKDKADDHLTKAVLRETRAVDGELYRSLRWMLENDIGDGSMLCATFSVSNGSDEVDLIDGGANITVTEENKRHYAFLVGRYRCRLKVAMELDAVVDGLADLGVTPTSLSSLTNTELHMNLNGRATVDVDEIRALAKYNGRLNDGTDFAPDHVVALWFWQGMHDIPESDRRLVLAFATGSSRVPVDGFNPAFTITLDASKTNDADLPSAHTCFNNIVLPCYSNYHALKNRLLFAIQNATTFELA